MEGRTVTVPRVLAIIVALCILSGIMAFALSRKSYADEYVAPCQDAEAARDRLESGDASHFDWIELETRHADKIMFFEFGGFVMYVLTRKGCVVSGPAVVDYAKDRGEPA
jgi:hypothetical protein